jgi:hypothetical protein
MVTTQDKHTSPTLYTRCKITISPFLHHLDARAASISLVPRSLSLSLFFSGLPWICLCCGFNGPFCFSFRLDLVRCMVVVALFIKNGEENMCLVEMSPIIVHRHHGPAGKKRRTCGTTRYTRENILFEPMNRVVISD